MKVNDLDEAERYHVGATIAGRYLVERPIGEGAMGAVALARHVSLDEKVAIKFLRPELRRDPFAIARLWGEAKALARIKSDHVARVLDMGATLSVGPYMVMEYLEGADLGSVIETEGPLPVERAVEVVLQACEALTVAHTVGITHRDIKPQNLFLARHGQFETLKILDFGIAEDEQGTSERSAARPADAQGTAQPLYGTPSYMSPERIRNEVVTDQRSDIWSLGVVLHELITGRAVFDAPTLTETCARVLSEGPVSLETDPRLLPPAVRGIIARCLERDPSRRYQSVEELAAALAPLATMQERFRGRSTGAFSRQLVEEQLLLSKTQRLQLPAPSASPPTPGELSSVLTEIGAALRWVARSVPVARVYDRPLWLYAAVALASGLSVALLAALVGDVTWISPPPVVRAERLSPDERASIEASVVQPASGVTSPQPPPARGSAALAEVNGGGARVSPSDGRAEAAAPVSPSASRSERAPLRSAPRRSSKANTKAGPTEGVSEPRARLVERRSSRVRLVDDQTATETGSQGNARSTREGKGASPAAQPEPGAAQPEWLELMRRDADER